MKKKLYLLIALVFIQCSNDTSTLSEKERNFAITQLNTSKETLLSTIDGLSDAQLHFKEDDTSWSIAECTEHITIFVDKVFEILEESLELPANPERRKDVKFSDKELIAHVQDRTNKTKTDEDNEPNNIYGDHDATIKAYKQKLDEHINYLRTTNDDLRNHYVNFGSVDTYQIFLYMAAHTNRHIAQIIEIKSSVNFPKD
ncbi:hypothetical protein ATO12_02540 [Aquimarina atlantica]|uniref:DinB-like domain-containing protein n=1 Tax=Aquimarina atlantica TaxID=1317122 RepID=A0A023C030_9FLAO|nr:DinB family protein [Aquimarina atlantica]EZH75687.1 hypothetical protein ATO12_02540 [Aquimarina atlantica]